MPNALCVAIPALLLLAGCAAAPGGEVGGRRIEVASIETRATPVICVEPRREAAPGWPQPNAPALSPPPFELLRDGLFLTCRALQMGVVSAEAHRSASLDQGAALLRAEAAADLLRIGARDEETMTELRAWHLSSPFLQVACQAAAGLAARGAERLAADILPYCGALLAARTTVSKDFLR
jgi:hypothetical protein